MGTLSPSSSTADFYLHSGSYMCVNACSGSTATPAPVSYSHPRPGSIATRIPVSNLSEILDWIELASDLVLDIVHQTQNPQKTGGGTESISVFDADACSKLWCLEMIGLMERNGFFPSGTLSEVRKSVS